jgi:catechol 2,3-dioxygenase
MAPTRRTTSPVGAAAAPVATRRGRSDINGMDAPNPTPAPTFASRTPLHIGAVGLAVRDLDRVAAFYRDEIGLAELQRDGRAVRLGAGETTLLELVQRPGLLPDDPRSAGLYHTAFLMPTRADLARWILHIAGRRVPISGASDHGVSEAFYLDDPEGNGVEVYSDRAPENWTWKDGLVAMPTTALDIEAIVAEVDPRRATYATAPDGLRIGHIHLRVGDLDSADAFYRGRVGLDLTRRRDGAAFLSSGGYHHHVGSNVWHSAGAGMRDSARAGLDWFSVETADDAAFERLRSRFAEGAAGQQDGFEIADPWGTRIRIMPPA